MNQSLYILFTNVIVFILLSCSGPETTEEILKTSITGTVLAKSNNNPIVGALISTEPITDQVTTSEDGKFAISNSVKAGTTYTIIATKQGYKEARANVIATDGENTVSTIFMDIVGTNIVIEETSIDFGTREEEKVLSIKNNGVQNMHYTISKENLEWVTIDKTSGDIAPSNNELIRLSVKRDRLKEDHAFQGILIINPTGGSIYRIPVTLEQLSDACDGEDDDCDGETDEDDVCDEEPDCRKNELCNPDCDEGPDPDCATTEPNCTEDGNCNPDCDENEDPDCTIKVDCSSNEICNKDCDEGADPDCVNVGEEDAKQIGCGCSITGTLEDSNSNNNFYNMLLLILFVQLVIIFRFWNIRLRQKS